MKGGTKSQKPVESKLKTAGKKELKPKDPLNKVIERVLSDPFRAHEESLPQVVEGDGYWKFKKEVIETIVKERLYKDKDLDKLYQKMINKNSSLDKKRLGRIWKEVIDDFNS